MESFSIACTTCRVQLRVRDPSAIGQILTCPRCGSMVLVEPPDEPPTATPRAPSPPPRPRPEPSPPATATDAASSDLTPPDPSDEFAEEGDQPPGAPEDADGLADTVEDLSVYGTRQVDGSLSTPLPPKRPAAPQGKEVENPLLPTDQWMSPEAQQWRNRALVASSVVCGIALAIGLFALVSAKLSATGELAVAAKAPFPQPEVPEPAPREQTAPNDQDSEPTSTEPTSTEPPGNEPPDSSNEAEPSSTDSSRPEPADIEPADTQSAEEESAETDRSGAESDGNESSGTESNDSDSAAQESSDAEAVENQSGDVQPGEPEGASAESESEGSGVKLLADEGLLAEEESTADSVSRDETVPPGFSARDSADDEELTGGPLAKSLHQFRSFMDDPSAPLPEGEEEVRSSEAIEESLAEVPAEEDGSSPPEPKAVDVAERLEDTFQEVEFDGMPLVEFLRFVGRYSTIPITLHPESVIWLRTSPAVPVSVRAEDTTVGEVLSQGLKSRGLGYETHDNGLVVARTSSTADGGLRKVPFDVSDIVSDEEAAGRLADQITDLIGPDSWESAGGSGTIDVDGAKLVVEQHEEFLFEVLFFLEKIRTARELSPRSRYDARLFQLATRRQQADAKLEESVSLNYVRPAPLLTIVRRLAKETGVQILVDWRALNEMGWTTETETTFQVSAQPLRQALVTLLDPLELSYRVVDAGTIQITTLQKLRSHVELEFYYVAELLDDAPDAEALIARLAEAVSGKATEPRIGFDPPSECLIAVATQPTQLRIAELLASWRETESSVGAPETIPAALAR